jgi:hypothetical protein
VILTDELPSEIFLSAYQCGDSKDIKGGDAHCLGRTDIHQSVEGTPLHHQSHSHIWYDYWVRLICLMGLLGVACYLQSYELTVALALFHGIF